MQVVSLVLVVLLSVVGCSASRSPQLDPVPFYRPLVVFIAGPGGAVIAMPDDVASHIREHRGVVELSP